MYDIIIIGAGTAGLSAAIYALRAGKKVLVAEKLAYGGQIIVAPHIENYPGINNVSGYEFAENLYQQALSQGAEIKFVEIICIKNEGNTKKVITNEEEILCKSVIIATGAKNRMLGLENEEKFIGLGVSFCANCDGAFYKGKVTAVCGGGNTALEDAAFLSEYCKKVYLIHRRDSFRGEQKILDRLKEKENVEFILDTVISSLNGKDRLSSLSLKNTKTDETKELQIDGLFIAIGQEPQNDSFKGLIDIDEKGYIIAGEDCRTKTEGVFVAGDCRTKTVRQLVTAAADGAVSALMACEYIGSLK